MTSSRSAWVSIDFWETGTHWLGMTTGKFRWRVLHCQATTYYSLSSMHSFSSLRLVSSFYSSIPILTCGFQISLWENRNWLMMHFTEDLIRYYDNLLLYRVEMAFLNYHYILTGHRNYSDGLYRVQAAVLTVGTELQFHWLLKNLISKPYLTMLMWRMISSALCDKIPHSRERRVYCRSQQN